MPAFDISGRPGARERHAWVCRDGDEADVVENLVGPADPGSWESWPLPRHEIAGRRRRTRGGHCRLAPEDLPPEWLEMFPSTAELFEKAPEPRPVRGLDADQRLVDRTACEKDLFESIEEPAELPALRGGFPAIEAFLAAAHRVPPRRKARAGISRERHARRILTEAGLEEGRQFAWQAETEPGSRPDFLFPSAEACHRPGHPPDGLRMLAAKRTCRDRWRQILAEAGRIPRKHLLTLDEGISEAQVREMTRSGVQLAVPRPSKKRYPAAIQPRLRTLDEFVRDLRALGGSKQ